MWASAGLVLVASGFGAYCFYIYTLSGNPFEWAHVITLWGDTGYKPGGAPWLVLARLGHTLLTHPYAFLTTERLAPYDSLNGLAAMAFVIATPFVWWRFGTGYGLLMAANLWLPLSSGQVEGLGRYCAVHVPVLHLAGERPIADRLLRRADRVGDAVHALPRALHDDPPALLSTLERPSGPSKLGPY